MISSFELADLDQLSALMEKQFIKLVDNKACEDCPTARGGENTPQTQDSPFIRVKVPQSAQKLILKQKYKNQLITEVSSYDCESIPNPISVFVGPHQLFDTTVALTGAGKEYYYRTSPEQARSEPEMQQNVYDTNYSDHAYE